MSRPRGKHFKTEVRNESRMPSHARRRANNGVRPTSRQGLATRPTATRPNATTRPSTKPHPRPRPIRSLNSLPQIDVELSADIRQRPATRHQSEERPQTHALPQSETRQRVQSRPRSDVRSLANTLPQVDAHTLSHSVTPEEPNLSPRRRNPSTAQVARRKPHRRHNERFYSLRSLLHSPLFAYAAAAVVLAVLLFVLTIPTPHYVDSESGQSADSPAKPYPTNEEPVNPRPIAHPLQGTSAVAVGASNAYGVLTQAIGEFEDTGDLISFAMRDLATGNTLTYDSGRVQYPASSIKAPYTCAVYELLLETGKADFELVRPLAEETILESSDEAYSELHDRYGMDVFGRWLQDADVGPGEYSSYGEMLIWHYPHMNTDQLLGMWLYIYDYVQRDTPYAQNLSDLLNRRQVSAMRDALGTEVRTQSKMGWFEYFGDFFSEPATVEAGIVYAPEGTYVVAVMTTAPAQISELQPIFTALARAHYDMI